MEIRSICCDPKLAPLEILRGQGVSLVGFRDLEGIRSISALQLEILDELVRKKLDLASAGKLRWRKDIKRFLAVEEQVYEIRWNLDFEGIEFKLRLAILENPARRSISLLGWYAKDQTLASEASRDAQNKFFRQLLDDRRG